MPSLTARRGADYLKTFRWLEDDRTTPINLTGYTVAFTVKINRVETTYTTVPEVTVTAVSGLVSVHIEDAVTALWAASGTWKLVVTSPGGIKTVLADGVLEVR